MAHRYRLYPEPSQLPMLVRHCADARYVWNLALEQTNYYRSGRPTPGFVERCRQLTDARKGTWLGEGSCSVQQQALRDEGFCVRDVSVKCLNRRWATLLVPKCGPVRFRLSRPLPTEYGMARVTCERSGRWHVSFSAPQPVLARTSTGAEIGLDVGVVATVTTSDGRMFHSPGLRPGEAQRLRRLQRKLVCQKKGSTRRARTKAAIAKLRARERDRRRDFVEQTTTALVRDFDVIAVEDLAVKRMMRSAKGTVDAPGVHVAAKRGLNRAIAGQAWSLLRRRLADKAATCGVAVVAVKPTHTSQRCAVCGHTDAENRKSQAVFRCRACGHEANADVNAANNILAAGLAVAARGGTSCSRGPDEARTQPVAA
jgi:putative transposase